MQNTFEKDDFSILTKSRIQHKIPVVTLQTTTQNGTPWKTAVKNIRKYLEENE